MRKSIALLAATALALAPASGFAAPTTTPPGPGDISPSADTGQLGVECDDGTPPGGSGTVHGSADVVGSPFFDGTSVSGSNYAGETTQNQKNTSSVSQYDIGCFTGPDRPQPE